MAAIIRSVTAAARQLPPNVKYHSGTELRNTLASTERLDLVTKVAKKVVEPLHENQTKEVRRLLPGISGISFVPGAAGSVTPPSKTESFKVSSPQRPSQPSASSSSSSASAAAHTPHLTLKPITSETRISHLEMLFKKHLEPICGSQKNALAAIKDGRSITCRLLQADEQPVGVVAYRRELTDRYREHGVKNCFEMTAFVAEDLNNGAMTYPYSSALLEKAIEKAQECGTKVISIVVSQKMDTLVNFLKKNHFVIKHTYESSKQLLLTCTIPEQVKGKRKGNDSKREEFLDGSGSGAAGSSRSGSAGASPAAAGSNRAGAGTDDVDGDQDQPQRKKLKTNSDGSYAKSSSHSRSDRFPSSSRRDDSTDFRESDSASSSSSRYYPSGSRNLSFSAPSSSFTKQNRKPIEATLKPFYLRPIKSGLKTIEGRINNGMFKFVKEGDTIRFFNHEDSVMCTVEKVKKYASFPAMLQAERIQSCLPEITDADPKVALERAINIYHSISGYEKRAAQHGVLAIHIKKNG